MQWLSNFNSSDRSFFQSIIYDIPNHIHLHKKILIKQSFISNRKIFQMHRLFLRQIPIHLFRNKRREGRHEFRECDQYVIQRLIRVILIRIVFRFPKSLTTPADIPVRKMVEKWHESAHCSIEFIRFHRAIHFFDEYLQFRLYPSIKKIFRSYRCSFRFPFIDIRIHDEKRIRIPQHSERIPRRINKVSLRKIKIFCSNYRRRQEIKSKRICTMLLHDTHRVGIIFEFLRHFLAIFGKHRTIHNHMLKCI